MAAGLPPRGRACPNPVGETVETIRRPSGLEIARVRVPLGVIGFYLRVPRPNVTADAARPLPEVGQRGAPAAAGARPLESNTLLAPDPRQGGREGGPAPRGDPGGGDRGSRGASWPMLTLDRYLDLIIPARRRGVSCAWSRERATVPVLKHDKGPLPSSTWTTGADLDMGGWRWRSTPRPSGSACANSLETLAGPRGRSRPALAAPGSPRVWPRFRWRCGRTSGRGPSCPGRGRPSRPTGTRSTFDYILAVRVVEDLEEAVAHIRRHGLGAGRVHRHPADVAGAPRRFHPRRWTRPAVLVNASDASRRRQPVSGWAPRWASPPPRVHARGPGRCGGS